MLVVQKGQAEKLSLVSTKIPGFKQQYVEQCARGAYISSLCQPEAAFDCSVAAQAQNSTEEDIAKFNNRHTDQHLRNPLKTAETLSIG